jgi:hypothetical protein
VQFGFGKKAPQVVKRETVIPEPSYNLPVALLGKTLGRRPLDQPDLNQFHQYDAPASLRYVEPDDAYAWTPSECGMLQARPMGPATVVSVYVLLQQSVDYLCTKTTWCLVVLLGCWASSWQYR